MAVSRRAFVRTVTVAGATAAVAPHLGFEAEQVLATQAQGSTATPTPEAIALQRMAYGPRPGDIATVKQLGLAAYIEQQLAPDHIDDTACQQRVDAAQFKQVYGTVNELRSVSATLSKSTTDLWPLIRDDNPFQERNLPWQLVRIATLIQAVYSKRQLKEVMVEFWHNHFNVRPDSDNAISVAFPDHDRAIRKNCFGNFRAFLEEVGRSTAMLYDLDNASNIASGGEGGNENYARELFELHTLGSDNYLEFYSDRTQIGTVSYNGETFARGYIDDDVYETARCFTGWTVSTGWWPQPQDTPNTGQFLYLSQWHDTSPKTVLLAPKDGNFLPNIGPRQSALADGKQIYDLLARHPGTARHICTKLARRLISDTPPSSVVDAAVAKWMATRDAPNQIEQVLRVILSSDEFQTTWGEKVKRPFEYVVGYLRATEAELSNDLDSLPTSDTDPTPDRTKGAYWNNFFWSFSNTGQRLFEWPTPTGHPDLASYWANSNSMLRCWNMLLYMSTNASWAPSFSIDLVGKTDMKQTCGQIVDFWIARLCGFTITPEVRQGLIDFLAMKVNGGDPSKPPAATKQEDANDPSTLNERLTGMVHLLAMSPDFQRR